jgi:hypothetical protein
VHCAPQHRRQCKTTRDASFDGNTSAAIAPILRSFLEAAVIIVQSSRPRGGSSRWIATLAVIASMQTEERRQLALGRGVVERSREVYVVALWVSGAVALLLLVAVAYEPTRSPTRIEPGAVEP